MKYAQASKGTHVGPVVLAPVATTDSLNVGVNLEKLLFKPFKGNFSWPSWPAEILSVKTECRRSEKQPNKYGVEGVALWALQPGVSMESLQEVCEARSKAKYASAELEWRI